MDPLEMVEFASNPEPRCPCVLLLDTSASMGGEPISALNEGLQTFYQDLQNDQLARKRVEVAIITFGNGGVQTLQDFASVGNEESRVPILTAGGNTPMGAAIERALDLLQERKNVFKKARSLYYRPWIFLITDGGPTDNWQTAAERVQGEERAKALSFFAVGVGEADMQTLAKLALRQPLKIRGLKFTELFLWLSASQKRVSASRPGETVALPAPSGWAEV